MSRTFTTWLLALCLTATVAAAQQQPGTTPPDSNQLEAPEANPARPTVSTPATLPPVGYLQFETGVLAAWNSPEFSSQTSLGTVIKLAVSRRIELLAAAEPIAHSTVNQQSGNATGDVLLGTQVVAYQGKGARPTLAVSYFHRVYSGSAPDLDIGSSVNSAIFLASADVKGFHYDTNYIFNEVVDDNGVRRTQFGQTLSVSHPLSKKFGLSGEIWHFTQPFLRSRCIGNLWAVSYNARKNLVFDIAVNRGLTSTSTHWELLSGFTYLLPHKLLRH